MNIFKPVSPLEKYIREVKAYLPRNSREDIGEELKANFEEKIADQEESSGAALDDEEIITMLSKNGHPVRVAAQYQGAGRALIGPDFYPYYRIAVLSALGISTIIMVLLLLIDLVYSLDIGDVSRVWMFVNTYIYIIGIITGACVISERIIEKNKYLESWSPSSTAPPSQAVASAWGAIFAVCALVTWLVILNQVAMDHSFAVLFGQTGNPFHTIVFWSKIQTVLLIPQYFYLIFNQTFSTERIYLRMGTEIVLLIGCITTLMVDTAGFRATYADLPDGLFTTFNWVIWAFIVAIAVELFLLWRKLGAIEDMQESAIKSTVNSDVDIEDGTEANSEETTTKN